MNKAGKIFISELVRIVGKAGAEKLNPLNASVALI